MHKFYSLIGFLIRRRATWPLLVLLWGGIVGASHLANLDRPAAFDLAIRWFVEGLNDADRPAEMDPVID